MTGGAPLDHVWIIGPGRLGVALGLALREHGRVARVTWSGRWGTPPTPLSTRRGVYLPDGEVPDPPPSVTVLTVPDAEISRVALKLAGMSLPRMPVLHTSGALGSDALGPLASRGHPVGSLHPLVAVARRGEGWERLVGAWFGLEGDHEAVRLAETIVHALNGRSLRIDSGAKPMYHAASVFASNFVVVLMAVGERLMADAGVSPEVARAALGELTRGAAANVAEQDPVRALTGPISRGDTETVALHLLGLSPTDRSLYSVLAREALQLARLQGLSPTAAARMAELLDQL